MSKYIVLVRQVPGLIQITNNAFDPETGTLVRSRLASVINEVEAQALALANKVRREDDDEYGRSIALTPGLLGFGSGHHKTANMIVVTFTNMVRLLC